MSLYIGGGDAFQELLGRNQHYKRNGFSESHWNKLSGSVKDFSQFCQQFNLGAPFPSSCYQLDLWQTHLASRGTIKCPKTISSHLSAIRTVNRLYSYPELDPSDPQIRLTFNGIRRELKWIPQKKRPHTLEIRKAIFQNLDFRNVDNLTFALISDVMFFLLLRVSNVLPKTLSSFNPVKQLCRDNVRFYGDRIALDFVWAKNNQYSERATTVSIMKTNCEFDTVSMMEDLFGRVPTVRINQPLFTRVYRASVVPVIRGWFINRYKLQCTT